MIFNNENLKKIHKITKYNMRNQNISKSFVKPAKLLQKNFRVNLGIARNKLCLARLNFLNKTFLSP